MSAMTSVFLRREYFGGILYSRREGGAFPIEEPIWSLVRSATTENGASDLHTALEGGRVPGLDRVVALCRRSEALDSALRLQCPIIELPYLLRDGALSSPLRTYVHMTFQCNADCDHCMQGPSKVKSLGEDMNYAEMLRLLNILRDVHCPELRLTGGEPTVRQDLPEIIVEAKERGFHVGINTNGQFGVSTRRRLLQTGMDEVIVSLDGSPERHDKRRGKGSFRRLDANMSALASSPSVSISLNFTFSRSNIADLEWVVAYAVSHNANVNLMPLRPFGAAQALHNTMLSNTEYQRFVLEVARLRRELTAKGVRSLIVHKHFDLRDGAEDRSHNPIPFDGSSCSAGTFGLAVRPDGLVIPCGFLALDERFVGPSILTSRFEHVWFGDPLRSWRGVVRKACVDCHHYHRSCIGGCKLMALAHGHGELAAMSGWDPYCPKTPPDVLQVPSDSPHLVSLRVKRSS